MLGTWLDKLPGVKGYLHKVQGTVLGTLMVLLVIVIIVDLTISTATNHDGLQIIAFLLAAEAHLIGIVLAYDLEYNHRQHKHVHSHHPREHHKIYKPPLETIELKDGPTISNITTLPSDDCGSPPPKLTAKEKYDNQQKGDPKKISGETDPSNYSSLASISTSFEVGSSLDDSYEDDYLYDRSKPFPCLCGLSISCACFFLIIHMLSIIIFFASIYQQVFGMNLSNDFSPKELARTLFLFTYGSFLASSFLSYYRRYVEVAFDISILRNKWFRHGLSLLLFIVVVGIALCASLARKKTGQLLLPFQYSGTDKPYWGEAWVTRSYLLDTQASCENYDDYLPVNVTVFYTSNFACPNLEEGQECEVTITSQVECSYLNSFLGPNQYDDSVADEGENVDDNPNDLTLDDYIYFRYHEYNVADGNQYNFDEIPSFNFWNRPSEPIVGSCDGTCSAQSEARVSEQFQTYAQNNHIVYLGLGMGILFLAYPLNEMYRVYNHPV